MVDEEVVMDTIRKMKDAGLEDSIIISTLEDIGLNDAQIQEFMAKASGATFSSKPSASIEKPPVTGFQSQAKPEAKKTIQAEEVFESSSEEEVLPEEDLGEFSEEEAAALSAAFEDEERKPAKPVPRDVPERIVEHKLSNEQIREKQTIEAIKKIKELPSKPQPYPAENYFQEQPFGKKAFSGADRFAEHIEETAMKQAATELALEEQEKKISEMRNSLEAIASKPVKLWAGASEDTKALMQELERLRVQIEETKAMTAATRALMEKILEVDRKILARLP
ncbi:MAG: hypothetical protein QXK06_00090 [Candidatus Diapherotrites archaeon]